MLRILALVALVLAHAPRTHAQPPKPATPHFEVATVRLASNSDPNSGNWSLPNVGKFEAHSLPLSILFQLAYGLDSKQITGKPAWFDSQLYDISAKPEAGVLLSREELKPMLQDLLVQRFHLQSHHETAVVRGYALLIAKGGAKLQPAKPGHTANFRVDLTPGHIEGLSWTMPFLALTLSSRAGLPVLDKTGLTGNYDIKLAYAPDLESDSSLPSLFTALQDSLGLKLDSQKIAVDTLVIDHIDRNPTEN